MTTLPNHQPTNKNFFQIDKWSFTITKMPQLMYFVQSVTLPSVSIGEVPIETPYSSTYRHGDKMVYEPITLTYLIDEDLKVWEETYNWMKGLTFPRNSREYSIQKKSHLYSDATLEFMTNSHTRNFRVKFTNCFPTSLSPIDLTYQENATSIPTGMVSFRYDTFEFER